MNRFWKREQQQKTYSTRMLQAESAEIAPPAPVTEKPAPKPEVEKPAPAPEAEETAPKEESLRERAARLAREAMNS